MEEQQQVEVEVEVPSYFVCPISLQIMRDPVTLPTGITYDRDGIERWLLTAGTCPLTKQPVPPDCDPTPNHTLRRLIQSWCALHADHGVDLVPTPKPPADRARVADLVSRLRAATSSAALLDALRELRDVAAESERNRKLLAAVPGAVDVLAAVVVASCRDAKAACDEALEIVCSLELSERCLARLVERNEELVDALVATLQRTNTTSRAHAALLLEAVTAVMPSNRLVSLPEEVFGEAVQLLRDRVSSPATRAALHVLVGTTSWGRNRVKAVDAGAVAVLVDMLLDGPVERRGCELPGGAGPDVRVRGGAGGAGVARRGRGGGGEEGAEGVGGGEREGGAGAAVGGEARGDGGGGAGDGADGGGGEAVRGGAVGAVRGEDAGAGAGDAAAARQSVEELALLAASPPGPLPFLLIEF